MACLLGQLYVSGERVLAGSTPKAGEWQAKVEGWWGKVGIIALAKKSVKDSCEASELGAHVYGKGQWIGGSCERIFKVCKASIWLLRKGRMLKKSANPAGALDLCRAIQAPIHGSP